MEELELVKEELKNTKEIPEYDCIHCRMKVLLHRRIACPKESGEGHMAQTRGDAARRRR